MESIAHIFEWKLPGGLLVFIGLMDALHMMHFIGENLGFLATPSGNLLVIAVGLLWLFLSNWAAQRKQSKRLIHEFALGRLEELFLRGQYLCSYRPHKDGDKTSALFWNDQVTQWTATVGGLLETKWTKQDRDLFLSLVGENPQQFAVGCHVESAGMYLNLLRYLKNFETLKHQLSKT